MHSLGLDGFNIHPDFFLVKFLVSIYGLPRFCPLLFPRGVGRGRGVGLSRTSSADAMASCVERDQASRFFGGRRAVLVWLGGLSRWVGGTASLGGGEVGGCIFSFYHEGCVYGMESCSICMVGVLIYQLMVWRG